jgi:hypothetical protein
MRTLIIRMPRRPPVMITQTCRDMPTATRIESIAKTTSVNSTRTTVLQKTLSPRNAVATGCAPRFVSSGCFQSVDREIERRRRASQSQWIAGS